MSQIVDAVSGFVASHSRHTVLVLANLVKITVLETEHISVPRHETGACRIKTANRDLECAAVCNAHIDVEHQKITFFVDGQNVAILLPLHVVA